MNSRSDDPLRPGAPSAAAGADAMVFHSGSCCKCGGTDGLICISEFGKALCPRCYPEFVRRRMEATVRRFRMIPKGCRVAVAISGGGDSGALLDMLARTRGRLNYTLTAIHLDMGLDPYSQDCIEVCREQARKCTVSLELERAEDYGVTVSPVGQWRTCAVCGAVRRALLPRIAQRLRADVICVGHTLDDQLMFMLKNVLSGHPESPAPLLPARPGYPAKAKPLIQIPEQATKRYAELIGLPVMREPCPHFKDEAHRLKEVFHHLERLAPMGKLQFFHTMRTVMRPESDDTTTEGPCEVCGAQTRMRVCPICRLKEAQEEEKPGKRMEPGD